MSNKSKSAIGKYLAKYSEPECSQLQSFPKILFSHCLVIPCYNEDPNFITELEQSLHRQSSTLIIIVVNQPPSNSHSPDANRQLAQYFKTAFLSKWSHQQLSLFESSTSSLMYLIVDRYNPEHTIPEKQGVGLARKIGCDLAVSLFHQHYLTTPWIHCSDADARLPNNYFQIPAITTKNQYSAAVYNFTHDALIEHTSPNILQATQLYEKAIKYYVAGLHWAGSPYDIHTIGSTIAVNNEAYCQVRGFPKRPAGEDFYVLNKLLKIAPAYRVKDITININARLSYRVPFGTGPAVERIMTLPCPDDDYLYYSPQNFIALKQWIDIIPSVWQSLQQNRDPLATLPEHIQDALNNAEINLLWPHITRQSKTKDMCEKIIHNWFDAFQTLKFIRRLQDSIFPAHPLNQCLSEAPFRI